MLVAVALGGALGASARFLAMSAVGKLVGMGFPYGTLFVNVAGSLLMGVVVELVALRWSTSAEMRALIAVGILGGFTTFSTFSLDIVTLMNQGNTTGAGVYIVVSVILSVAALILGLRLTRFILM